MLFLHIFVFLYTETVNPKAKVLKQSPPKVCCTFISDWLSALQKKKKNSFEKSVSNEELDFFSNLP